MTVGTDTRVSFQRYKQFAHSVNQPAASWVVLRAKRTLISSLSNSFVETHNLTPLKADSFDLACTLVSVAGMR